MQFVLGCFSVGFLWTPRLRESLKKIFHVFKILKSILLWYLFYWCSCLLFLEWKFVCSQI
ncbi:hypothetical protein OIU77_014675 [Salix suchowensis]|uniref:Uncharacterized protein n=1 Tax=Salix suchowensis TaxID=1278906 RepID=A0ABQ8ZY34_9ROSI|nr:hypothetical protein OIU77_014675 [Salix suchowensis]